MTQYVVINNETGYYEEFFNLTAAKKAMKENNAKGSKFKIYSDGEWVNCGEITLKRWSIDCLPCRRGGQA